MCCAVARGCGHLRGMEAGKAMRTLAAIALAACAGCAQIQHHTASGRPEATISAPAPAVKAAVAGTLLNLGYALKKDTDLQIVAERRVDNLLANALLGSKYDPTVESRITLTFLQAGAATRVTADLGIVRNGGSAFEAVTDTTNSEAGLGAQAMLDDVGAAFKQGGDVGTVVADASQRSIARRGQ